MLLLWLTAPRLIAAGNYSPYGNLCKKLPLTTSEDVMENLWSFSTLYLKFGNCAYVLHKRILPFRWSGILVFKVISLCPLITVHTVIPLRRPINIRIAAVEKITTITTAGSWIPWLNFYLCSYIVCSKGYQWILYFDCVYIGTWVINTYAVPM